MRARSLFLAVGMIAILEGCGSTGPRGWTISEQSYQLACHQWFPKSPPFRARYAFDIWFADSAADGGPAAEDVAAVRARGGEVLYRYHLPGIRVAIDAAQLLPLAALSLSDPGFVWQAETVADTAVTEVLVLASLSRPYTDADRVFVESLGGQLISFSTISNWYSARIPDGAVPNLRAASGVLRVERDGGACLAS